MQRARGPGTGGPGSDAAGDVRMRMKPMRHQHVHYSLFEWDVFVDWAEEHRWAWFLVLVFAFLLYKEYETWP